MTCNLLLRCAQLVGELVQHITEGTRAGTSWVKPLALRTAQNATLACAAQEFDPTLGWCGEKGDGDDAVPSRVHFFSPLAPAAFVPSSPLVPVPAPLALAVRTMSSVHTSAAEESVVADDDGAQQQAADMRVLSAFMALVGSSTKKKRGGGGGELYDPLA